MTDAELLDLAERTNRKMNDSLRQSFAEMGRTDTENLLTFNTAVMEVDGRQIRFDDDGNAYFTEANRFDWGALRRIRKAPQ